MQDCSPDPSSAQRGAVSAEASALTAPPIALRQRAFAEAILDPARPVPPGLVGPDGEPSARRFAVYRNNVVTGLIEALKHAFPAVLRIVGHEFFSAMARLYIVRQPPPSPIMLGYGASFPDFVRTFGPGAALPYLSDVARLERAWLEAYHAAEARPIDRVPFLTVDRSKLPRLRFTLHPAVRIVRSSFPAVRIWQMNTGDSVPAAVDIDGGGEDALVTRPEAEVEVRVLPAGAAAFIGVLGSGAPIIEATKAALHDDPSFDLAGALTGLLAARAIAGWSLREEASDNQPGRPA